LRKEDALIHTKLLQTSGDPFPAFHVFTCNIVLWDCRLWLDSIGLPFSSLSTRQ